MALCLALPVALLKQDTTDWLAYKQQKSISHSSGAWKLEIKVPAWSNKGFLPGRRLLIVSSPGRRGWGALWRLFYKGTNLIHKGSSLMTLSPSKGST